VLSTWPTVVPASGICRSPTSATSGSVLWAARTVTLPSLSSRIRALASTSRTRLVSLVTASKISAAGTPCATSVATRRSAACSSATRLSSSRASAFGDRGRDEFRELGEPLLRARWKHVPARGRRDHQSPGPAGDGDRHADRRGNAPRLCAWSWGAGRLGVAVEARGPPGLEDQGGDVSPAQDDPRAHGGGIAGPVPAADGRHAAVDVVAADVAELGGKEPPYFLGDRREQRRGRRRASDQRRDPAQSRLLMRQLLELLARGPLLVQHAQHPHRQRRYAGHAPQQPTLLPRQPVGSRSCDHQGRTRRMLQRRRRRRARTDARAPPASSPRPPPARPPGRRPARRRPGSRPQPPPHRRRRSRPRRRPAPRRPARPPLARHRPRSRPPTRPRRTRRALGRPGRGGQLRRSTGRPRSGYGNRAALASARSHRRCRPRVLPPLLGALRRTPPRTNEQVAWGTPAISTAPTVTHQREPAKTLHTGPRARRGRWRSVAPPRRARRRSCSSRSGKVTPAMAREVAGLARCLG
jgi:hypothetical protein